MASVLVKEKCKMDVRQALGLLVQIADQANGNGNFHRQVGIAIKTLHDFIDTHEPPTEEMVRIAEGLPVWEKGEGA
jgi:hypothetical protein